MWERERGRERGRGRGRERGRERDRGQGSESYAREPRKTKVTHATQIAQVTLVTERHPCH